ncbi:hypothetical protein Adt_18104 [Abeliophyllum distichum]|uniref:Uncharacterized protein n=1 Tax=Abeliophyllum distichum TaxID=126358 RepID=A0ABD1TIF3_9LAMI
MLWRGRELGGESKAALPYGGRIPPCQENLPSCGRRPKATGLCSGIAVISKYCKGNNLAVEYLLGLKLVGLYSEDVSFATDQTEHHLEVRNIGYESYDSLAKTEHHLSLGVFLRIYCKGGMPGSSLDTQKRPKVTVGALLGPYAKDTVTPRDVKTDVPAEPASAHPTRDRGPTRKPSGWAAGQGG